MNFSISDLRLLRWNILVLCASILGAAIAIISSNEYAAKILRDKSAAQSQLNNARNRLQSAQEDQQNMVSYANEYETLRGLRIIGDDQRLDWLEGLEKIRREHLVNDFRYSIAPQKIYAAQPPIDSGNFDVHYSETKLQFDLLHEGQLLDFFAALRGQIKGWYQLEGCTLQRISSQISNDEDSPDRGAAPRIKAECTGGWITLKNRNTQQ